MDNPRKAIILNKPKKERKNMENIPTNQTENYSGNNNIISTSPKTNPLTIVILIFLLLLVSAGSFVLGKYFTENKTEPVDETVPIAKKPVALPTTGPTADWKTYENQQFKFQIKYPADWNLKEDKTLQNIAFITTTITAPSKNSFIDIWVRSGSWSQIVKELGTKSTKITLNGITGLVEAANKGGKVYTFPSQINNQVFQIVYGESSDSPLNEITTLDQILSTFKFL